MSCMVILREAERGVEAQARELKEVAYNTAIKQETTKSEVYRQKLRRRMFKETGASQKDGPIESERREREMAG